MKIIIPMAGDGKRFKDAGFKEPKPMVLVKDKTLFEWSMLSLRNFFDHEFIFVTQTKHNTKDFIKQKCEELGIKNYKIKELDRLTKGPAETVSEAQDLIDDLDEEIVIYNTDTYIKNNVLNPEDIQGEGFVYSFETDDENWGFAEIANDSDVLRTEEKVRISPYGIMFFFYFKSFNLFKECYDNYSLKGYKEEYLVPLCNGVINKGLKVKTKKIDFNDVLHLGTPEDIVSFWPEFTNILKTKSTLTF